VDTDNDGLVTIAKPGMREAEYFMYIGLINGEKSSEILKVIQPLSYSVVREF